MLNGSLAAALALTVVPLNIFPQSAKAEGTATLQHFVSWKLRIFMML